MYRQVARPSQPGPAAPSPPTRNPVVGGGPVPASPEASTSESAYLRPLPHRYEAPLSQAALSPQRFHTIAGSARGFIQGGRGVRDARGAPHPY